jgi:predicted enzyme related to lactoylglutathione lyase
VYLSARDVAAVATRAEQGGAKIVMGPMEIPGSGHMLYAFDPTGAAFGVWQPGNHLGAGLFGEPGALTWAELNARDAAAADNFYRGLFGYEQEQIGDGSNFDYTVWKLDGRMVCGRMLMTAEWGDTPPFWTVYLGVEDADAAARRITEAGGRLREQPFDSPYGRIAVAFDPHGAVFNVIDDSRRSAG